MKLNTCEGVIWNKIRVFDTELQSNSMFYFPVNKNHDEFFRLSLNVFKIPHNEQGLR